MEPTIEEQILDARENEKRKTGGNIHEKNTYIDGMDYTFESELLFSSQVSVPVPLSFEKMPEKLLKVKYPMEARPQLVLTSSDTSINFAFNLFKEQALLNKQVKEVTDGFQNIVKRMQPANHFYEKKIATSKDRSYGWFDFKSPGLDEPVYTLMTFTPVGGHFFHGIFNCAAQKMPDWKPVFLQIIHDLSDQTEQ